MSEWVDGYPHGMRPGPRENLRTSLMHERGINPDARLMQSEEPNFSVFENNLYVAMTKARTTNKPVNIEFEGLTITVQPTRERTRDHSY